MHNERDAVPRVQRAEEGSKVVPVPEQHVGKHGAERQVRRNEVECVRARKKGRLRAASAACDADIEEITYAELLVLRRVEASVREQRALVVLRTVCRLKPWT